ncbi:MAG: DUF421 domain-containing protein [Actinobacteria bacterium]|nr:DUF421 domain-containing protein [Actinomycetota bacterium]
MWSQLGMTWSQLWLTVVSAIGVYATIITLSRIFGQRQFATSTTYDLAFNFAMGSLIGRTLLVRVSLLNAVVALCAMFLLHAGATWWHHRYSAIHDIIQNRPVLLVVDGKVLDDALRRTGTSRLEVNQALRLAGIGAVEDVGAVILERNGQFSVFGTTQRRTDDVFDEVVDVRR